MSRLSRELAKCLIFLLTLSAMPAVIQADEPITLNFKDAEIDSVVGAFGHLLNRTFVGCFIAYFAQNALAAIVFTWLPSYFENALGFSAKAAGSLFGLPSVAASSVRIASTS